MNYRVHIRVMPRRGLLDPQGQAVLHAIGSLGYSGVREVRVGKLIELDLEGRDKPAAEAEVKALCERLLANTVIEEYRFELQD